VLPLKFGRRKKMLNTVAKPELNEISNSITKNWTTQAIECYKLNGNCTECSIRQAHYTFDCQMPKVVEILKLINGEPKE
jgi:hypothetical protein